MNNTSTNKTSRWIPRTKRGDFETEFPPSGCRHCGLAKFIHFNEWTRDAGSHVYTTPTTKQIWERMQARAARRGGAR